MSDSGRSVVVTGGTGALGRAVVDAFLAAGDRVTVPWIVAQERESLSSALGDALAADRLRLVEADVAEEAGAADVVGQAGGADVLVNGVGGFGGGSPVHETDLALWDRMYRMNLRTAAAMSRAAAPGMLARGAGVIVSVASRAALDRPAGLAAYSASKAGVLVLTETLQRELGASGVRVHAVVPTTIDTPANRRAMPDADFSSWTPPAAIAGVITWLASEAARTVRGALVPV
jgi:NAD(P)-dependent dehydrogenase (short-subunit alcohol dehydrogenase family)